MELPEAVSGRAHTPDAAHGSRLARHGPARAVATAFLLLAAAGCNADRRLVSALESAAAGASPTARSTRGMVVTGAPLATAVGAHVLERGGNAVDAAVAVAFALAVVEPSQSGIGGRTQILMRLRDGTVAAIDGTTEVPRAWTDGPADNEDAYGYPTIGVPGTVAALDAALRAHGSLPLAQVMAPAIALAGQGFTLSAAEAGRIASVAEQLREFAGSREAFLKPDGEPWKAGERFAQPLLAATLRTIAAGGADAFYRGEIARRIAEDVQAQGGFVTVEDLAAYRAEASIVVRGRYRDHELIGSYLPASGATTIEILQILDHLVLPDAGSPEWVAIVAQALLMGFADRTALHEPPAGKAAWLVSADLAIERAAAIRWPAVSTGRPGLVSDTIGETRVARESEFTTHVSVADGTGNVVALTQSVGPTMGSRVATPGLGFAHAATMEYLGRLEPGTRRHWSSQSPLIVLANGRPRYVLGGAGARRILSGIVETLSRALDQGMALEPAQAAPRFHPSPSRIDMEVREGLAWSAADMAALRAFGFAVETRDYAPYFARVNAIEFDTVTSEWVGVSDPRWQGTAQAPRR
jgi:gamma-glutamyltranspeptidase/glutathione hydrolase